MSSRDEETSSTKSSSSPERPARVRGRGRSSSGRGRGTRSGSRGRAQSTSGRPVSRGRGSRSRGRGSGTSRATLEVTAAERLRQRQETMREEIATLSSDEKSDLLLQAVNKMPSLMLDLMRPAQQHPSRGYHPGPGDATPDWCVCGLCREMPTDDEKVCCQKEHCVSLLPDFEILILDEGVLALARMMRRDILVFNDEPDHRRANRHQAYRQYILWSYGRLTGGDRRVVPSCCIWKIRDKFPDPFGQYTGFKASRLA